MPAAKKAKKKAGKTVSTVMDTRRLINPDLPFEYDEVAAATGSEYVQHLVYDGVVQKPYEQLKADYMALLDQDRRGTGGRHGANNPGQRGIRFWSSDDEMAVNNNIRKILSKKDYKVDQAASKEEALVKIAAKPYELVLLDLRIPGVRGLELLAAIRDKQPKPG